MAKTDRDKKGVEEKPSNRKKRATLKPMKKEKYVDYRDVGYTSSDRFFLDD